jgi:hypothetical protein
MSKRNAMIWVGVVSLFVIACSASNEAGGRAGGPDTDRPFSETVVVLNADGTQTVNVTRLTAAEAEQRSEMRAAERANPGLRAGAQGLPGGVAGTISAVSCSSSDHLILTDGTCSGGANDAICFAGAGTANLAGYCRTWLGSMCTSWWDGHVQTWDAVDSSVSGYVASNNNSNPCSICLHCNGCVVDFAAGSGCVDNNGAITVNYVTLN